jgi:N-acetyl-anhydromuramyl-L-alanine amidase AmpD
VILSRAILKRSNRRTFLVLALVVSSSLNSFFPKARAAAFAPRAGDEIVVAGQFVHTGTPVVLWLDPGGYDAYRVERRFSPLQKSDWDSTKAEIAGFGTPNRYSPRRDGLTVEETERVRGGGWDLATLQKVVDQFVIHYDAAGTSRNCFKELQDIRDLSVHFMLDLDGTIYQTLDLKEQARHATGVNNRSVGIEIANAGAWAAGETNVLGQWYARDTNGQTRITIPQRFGDGGLRNKGFISQPARPELVTGKINGEKLDQYDFTPEQYDALIKLTATLCEVFPKLKCDVPRDAGGKVVLGKLPDNVLTNYHGMLGHFHITTNKVDPGPAFQWDYVIENARKLIAQSPEAPVQNSGSKVQGPKSEAEPPKSASEGVPGNPQTK